MMTTQQPQIGRVGQYDVVIDSGQPRNAPGTSHGTASHPVREWPATAARSSPAERAQRPGRAATSGATAAGAINADLIGEDTRRAV